jgi:hypothetical protein
VTKDLKEGKKCYEFDLKSFFNTVSRDEIKKAVEMYCGKLCAKIVDKILIGIKYKYEGLLPEKELKLFGTKIHGKEEMPVLIRSGIPQGLNISPVISTMVLEANGSPKGLTMFADDGLYLYEENRQEFDN